MTDPKEHVGNNPERNNHEPPDASPEALRREAARRMGQARSEAKAAAVRENGKKGGRPPGTKTSEAAKARMRDAQRQRRAREGASDPQGSA